MRRISLIMVGLLAMAALFANGCKLWEKDVIVLAQGKPEIDGQLKAYAAAWAEENGVEVVIKSCGGGNCDLGQQLKADYAAGEMPDIFAINGLEDYLEWQAIAADLSDEAWVDKTDVAFVHNGKTFGFPVSIEGWGLAYNADILAEAGVDPKSLVNLSGYREAFAKIDSMKEQLGLDSVVSMAAGTEMFWVTTHHNLNSLLSNGLQYGDTSVVDQLLAGQVDSKRLSEYVDWVELLFQYADKAILTTGNYDAQVGAFATGKAAFLHQGNWTDPNMADANATFEMAFAPHGSMEAVTDGIFVSAPSFYLVNVESANAELAKKFLVDLATTSAGANYIVKEAKMIPAFTNITLNPDGQLSSSVQDWMSQGKVYSWNQYLFSAEFRDKTLAPIYNQFANDQIDKARFIQLLTEAFQNR
ncbi:multiple sugar-binding transport system multiple sugar-binding protein [Olavius algarvensis spirochete endosymbiont]|uniref:ABC transporter substrate-binding protein n=1 Tax=Olavius algarvensis spirochete endosymbiont TaxID=260710 RepID=UPI000F15DEC0|nr:extracellular solute-binding protein [Olavius algarvensis spirochete endosymbiont]VDB00405.1 multiple sugar-binding transport system multiple sugar-binding protein [Olavius algarvensis spirochete endosymbiont]